MVRIYRLFTNISEGTAFLLKGPPYFVFAREPFSRFIRYRFVNAITKIWHLSIIKY